MSGRAIPLVCLVLIGGCRPDGSASSDSPKPPVAPSVAADSESVAAGSDWKEEFDTMTTAVPLSNEESARLRAAFEFREEEVSQWMASNGARLEGFEKQMRQAAKSKDLSGVRSAKSKAEPLRNELRALIEKHQAEIEGALSADNAVAWASWQLTTRLTDLMQDLSLTPVQVAEIRTAAGTAVENSAGEKNPRAAGFLALERAVESQILTADQRTAYEAVKKKNPMRSLR